MIVFKPEFHEYISLEGDTQWTSVTSIISKLKEPFDAEATAERSSKNKKSKWYGLDKEEILKQWNYTNKVATDLGNWYHNQRETDVCELHNIEREGYTIPIVRPIIKEGLKYSPPQKVSDGMYPEHLVYMQSAGLCGQSDLVEIVNGFVNITDYKSNKEIRLRGYQSWDGTYKKMLSPVNHLEDCHINHYALQLSIYMYMILRHNPKLKPGKMCIHHVMFRTCGKDKYDNPIYEKDNNGDPIVMDVEVYDLPYLKEEKKGIGTFWLKQSNDKLKYTLYRQEYTCMYIFGDKEELKPLLGNLPLYS